MLHKPLGREFRHPSNVGSISSAGWEAGSRFGGRLWTRVTLAWAYLSEHILRHGQ